MEVPTAQRRLIKILSRLERLTHQLHETAAALPRPADQEGMYNDQIAYDVATEMDVRIRLVLDEHLRPAMAQLRTASTLTDEALRHDFERRRTTDCCTRRAPS